MRFQTELRNGQRLIIDKAFWTGKTEVRLDNVVLGQMGFAREKSFVVELKDGSQHALKIKHPLLDPLPYALLNGCDVFSSERFNKLQTAILCLPAILILQLGAIPGLVAACGVYLNFLIARNTNLTKKARWTLAGCTPVIGLAITTGTSILVWGNSGTTGSVSTHSSSKNYDPYSPDRHNFGRRSWDLKRRRAEEAEREVEFGPGQ